MLRRIAFVTEDIPDEEYSYSFYEESSNGNDWITACDGGCLWYADKENITAICKTGQDFDLSVYEDHILYNDSSGNNNSVSFEIKNGVPTRTSPQSECVTWQSYEEYLDVHTHYQEIFSFNNSLVMEGLCSNWTDTASEQTEFTRYIEGKNLYELESHVLMVMSDPYCYDYYTIGEEGEELVRSFSNCIEFLLILA